MGNGGATGYLAIPSWASANLVASYVLWNPDLING